MFPFSATHESFEIQTFFYFLKRVLYNYRAVFGTHAFNTYNDDAARDRK